MQLGSTALNSTRLDQLRAISRSATAIRSPTPRQLRSFAAVFPQSGPSFCEECSEALDRTPFGRCTRRTLAASHRRGAKVDLAPLKSILQALDRSAVHADIDESDRTKVQRSCVYRIHPRLKFFRLVWQIQNRRPHSVCDRTKAYSANRTQTASGSTRFGK